MTGLRYLWVLRSYTRNWQARIVLSTGFHILPTPSVLFVRPYPSAPSSHPDPPPPLSRVTHLTLTVRRVSSAHLSHRSFVRPTCLAHAVSLLVNPRLAYSSTLSLWPLHPTCFACPVYQAGLPRPYSVPSLHSPTLSVHLPFVCPVSYLLVPSPCPPPVPPALIRPSCLPVHTVSHLFTPPAPSVHLICAFCVSQCPICSSFHHVLPLPRHPPPLPCSFVPPRPSALLCASVLPSTCPICPMSHLFIFPAPFVPPALSISPSGPSIAITQSIRCPFSQSIHPHPLRPPTLYIHICPSHQSRLPHQFILAALCATFAFFAPSSSPHPRSSSSLAPAPSIQFPICLSPLPRQSTQSAPTFLSTPVRNHICDIVFRHLNHYEIADCENLQTHGI